MPVYCDMRDCGHAPAHLCEGPGCTHSVGVHVSRLCFLCSRHCFCGDTTPPPQTLGCIDHFFQVTFFGNTGQSPEATVAAAAGGAAPAAAMASLLCMPLLQEAEVPGAASHLNSAAVYGRPSPACPSMLTLRNWLL